MNNNVLKWLILTSTCWVAVYVVEATTGVFAYMASEDKSGICYLLWGLAVFGTGFVFHQCFRNKDQKDLHFQRVEGMSFIAQVLGLLGTVIGLALMFGTVDLANVDSTDQEGIKNMMAVIVTGMSTAFYTTITGILISVYFWLFKFVIGHHGGSQ